MFFVLTFLYMGRAGEAYMRRTKGGKGDLS